MTRALVALAVLAGCPDKKQPPNEAPVVIVTKSDLTYQGSVASPPRIDDGALDIARAMIPETTRQLITAAIEDWTSTHARLQLWTRSGATSPWTLARPSWSAVIGKNGAAWGNGLHGDNFSPAKVEGDGKAPAGMFRLRGSYGYGDKPPEGSKLPYARADRLECVDDPASKQYTKIVDGSGADRDWKSSEQMLRTDELYTWVIDIGHNATAVPGDGSCIFFHVWSGPDSSTVGCTAMDEGKLVELMKQLDPAADPIYVLLPRKEYTALHARWGLPPL